jgi:hypothetical protein
MDGTCSHINATAQSGAALNAANLPSETAAAQASGGANLRVNAGKSLTLNAASGALIIARGGGSIDHSQRTSGGAIIIKP